MLRLLAARPNGEPRVCLVAAQAAAAFGNERTGRERSLVQPELAAPLTVQRPGIVVAGWQRQRSAERSFEGEHLRPAVRHDHRPRNQVVLGEEVKSLGHVQPDGLVFEDEVQGWMTVDLEHAVFDERQPRLARAVGTRHDQAHLLEQWVTIDRICHGLAVEKRALRWAVALRVQDVII